MVHLERRYRFSASHLYWRPEWSDAVNRSHFGKCANFPGHGHNYRLFVTISGVPNRETGFLVDLGFLDSLLQAQVLDVLDHQHLNSAVPEFGDGELVPSSENLVIWISRRLQENLPTGTVLSKLRLEEDEDLAAEWLP